MMRKTFAAALLSLSTVSTSLLPYHVAKADEVIYCNSAGNQASRKAADQSRSYASGYQDGEQSFRKGQSYKPQNAGGEYAYGFEDGYFNRPFTGQEVIATNRQECGVGGRYIIVPSPTVIYGYPYVVAPPIVYSNPYPFVNFGIGFNFFNRGFYRR